MAAMITPMMFRLLTLGVLLLSGPVLGRPIAAAADDQTPVVATPVPTAIATQVVVTPAPTILPTVVREISTPFSTVVAPTASVPEATATTYVAIPTPTPRPAVVQPTSVVSPPPTAPWPSAADLQANARLRWGHGMPASVRRWAFLIVPNARKFHVDPNLIAAVMTMESNGDPLALSYADARGLMQILHGPWEPATNVEEGARMLAALFDQFGDWQLALAAYNAGPGAVESAGGIPAIRETRDYVIIVMYLWGLYAHHPLSAAERARYRSTLQDLQNYADQRNKVVPLARIARVLVDLPPQDVVSVCSGSACSQGQTGNAFDSLDPFWPVGDAPDPLQHVDPLVALP
jgi:hypothetical protein